MAQTFGEHSNFSQGVISEFALGDLRSQKYTKGVKVAENCVVTLQGRIKKRPGSKYIADSPATTVQLFPYILTGSTHYLGVFYTNTVKIYDKTGSVQTTKTISLSSGQVGSASWVQDEDTIYHVATDNTTVQYLNYRGGVWSVGTFAGLVNPSSTYNYNIPPIEPLVRSSGDLTKTLDISAVYQVGQTNIDITVNGGSAWSYSWSTNSNEFVMINDGLFLVTSKPDTHTLRCTCYRSNTAAGTAVAAWQGYRTAAKSGGGPALISIHNQRMVLAGFPAYESNSGYYVSPSHMFVSAAGDFRDFYPGPNDDDGITFTKTNANTGGITWAISFREFLFGTDISENTVAGDFTSSTGVVKKREEFGSVPQRAVSLGHSFLMIPGSKNTVIMLNYSYELDSYIGTDLLKDLPEYAEEGIEQVVFAKTPNYRIYARTTTGKILCGTWFKDTNTVAWSRWTTNGTYDNLCVLRNDNADELWVKTTRNSNGYIEKFIETDGTSGTDGFSDCYTAYSGSATTSITGLSRFNGVTVQVKGNAKWLSDGTPSSGSLTLGESVTTATVGLEYTMKLETVDYNIPIGNIGTYLGQKFRWVEPIIRAIKTGIFSVNNMDVPYVTPTLVDGTEELFSGDFVFGPSDGDYSSLTITSNSPHPVHIQLMMGRIEFDG